MANVPAHVVNNPMPRRIVEEIFREIQRQDQKWGIIEGATSAGAVRLALALIEDELEEAHDAWSGERILGPREMHTTRAEVIQVAAVAIRALRDTL